MSTFRFHFKEVNRYRKIPALFEWTEFLPMYGYSSAENDAFFRGVIEWCETEFGAGQRVEQNDDGVTVKAVPTGRWALMGLNFLVRDPDDAMAFKLRWG